MDKYFKGKRILVTGGCQGIGRGIVLELWRQGANVVTLSNQPENLAKLKEEYPSIEVVSVDLRDWENTREVVNNLGVFEGLVNNAGIAIIEPFLECSSTSFDETMAVNVRAILNVSQIVAKKMINNGIRGSIVNVSSQAALVSIRRIVGNSVFRLIALRSAALITRVKSIIKEYSLIEVPYLSSKLSSLWKQQTTILKL